ncbi:MAG TPA: polyphosphate:AMP phosphotransferase [Planctomycetota bacterium]|jgi:polyphosphate:AMP phosphotransferase
MFEAAELGNSTDKATYKRESIKVREALLAAQHQLATANFSVVIVIGGVEGAGKPETMGLLLEWMDPRGIQTHALQDSTDEERERPPYWRFWRLLPPHGRIGVFAGSWYTDPIVGRALKNTNGAQFDQQLQDIVSFETMLSRENVLVFKLWLHMPKRDVKVRLEKLAATKKTRWRVSKTDWKFFGKYDAFREVSEHALGKTSTANAPWVIVEATDWRYRALTVGRALVDALQKRLAEAQKPKPQREKPPLPRPDKINIIRKLDMTQKLSDEKYEKKLLKYSGKFNKLTRAMYEKKRSLVIVFEGPDAAGKGGAIRRLTGAMDPRNYQVISIAAPTDEERVRPYLWRFWRSLPRAGRVGIFDRSWYGRVLVERIEGFCAPEAWQRAFTEINSFEDQISQYGVGVVKFWLTITSDEQLRRFKDRETTPYKQYKLTEEDWRNRARWDAYEAAACDMIERTSTEECPWVLVEANDKNWARIKVLKTVCETVERLLDR